jgi:hypothetical protein
MSRLPAAFTLAAALVAGAAPPSGAREVTVKGIGGKPCSQWTEAHRARKPEMVQQDAWLAGFITGFNAYGLKESKDVAPGGDPATIPAAITAWCAAHPTDNLFRAAVALVSDLQGKSGAK